jgi:hypothetical protein
MGPGDHRHGLELEGVEGLARQEVGFGEMALDAAAIALGEFVFRDGGEETGSGPTFLIGLFGEFGPYELDRRKTQFVEKDAKLGGIDGAVRLHAASPIVRSAPIRAS